jgi:diguanylate cyclase (GGDEF)-like protein/PAS domain S-box-containing protein
LAFTLQSTGARRGTLSIADTAASSLRAHLGFPSSAQAVAFAASGEADRTEIPLDEFGVLRAILLRERNVGTALLPIGTPTIAVLAHQIAALLEASCVSSDLTRFRHDLASIVDNALAPFVSIDRAGIIREWNAAATATFGWSREDALGKRIVDLIVAPELRARHIAGMERYRAGARSNVVGNRVTMPAVHRDGSQLIVEMRVAASQTVDGADVYHAFIHNVTEVERTRERLSRSERLLREAQTIASIGSYEHDLHTGEVVASEQLYRIAGLDPVRPGVSVADITRLVHRDDEAMARALYLQAIRERRSFDFEYRMLPALGGTIVVRSRGYPVIENGEPVRVLGTVQDVTTARRVEFERRDFENRFREAFDNAPVGISITSAEPADFGRVIRANAACCGLLDYTEAELIGRDFASFIVPEDGPAVHDARRALLDGNTTTVQSEMRMVRRDGSVVWVSHSRSLMRDEGGTPICFFVHVEDITQRKTAELQLEHLAYHDGLTGVLNRRGLSLEMARGGSASTSGAARSLLLLDLDHFKYVNDTMGHAAGDRILRKVARTLRRAFDPRALIGRLGSDQFLIILAGLVAEEAIAAADHARAMIESSIYLSSEAEIRATASIGIATLETWNEYTLEEAIAAADTALASAKSQGRNRTVVASTFVTTHAAMRDELTWTQRIRNAFEHDRFRLYGQPIINLRTRRIERYELLLRMLDEDGTVRLPSEFLPVAERAGLMPEVDCWVVGAAVAVAAARTETAPPLVFEINLSGASLNNGKVSAYIERVIEQSAVDPRSLVFEITETAAIANMDQACAFAERITALGCAFALDDFGAGFSSFYYLKYLPFSDLKIDGEFIRNLRNDRSDQHIVRAIVELARGLGKATIAEFVGDNATATLLLDYGVDFAQGYCVGRPVAWSR